MEDNPLTSAYESQLIASQKQMLHLNAAVPLPSTITRQHLDYWFARTFPALAGKFAVSTVSVRTLREETIAPTQHTFGAAATQHPLTGIFFLEALFWRAVAGYSDARDHFLDPDNIEIIIEQSGTTQIPATLNSRDAKEEFKKLLNTTPARYERLLAKALDDFWNKPADFSQGRNVGDWLAKELEGQLKAQADLHLQDATLSPVMHKTLTEQVLSAPDATSRSKLPEHQRPGVHGLNLMPQGWNFSVPVSRAIVLTRHDDTDHSGAAVLYRLGEPLDIHEDLATLKTRFKEDENAGDDVDTVPVTENFLAHLVGDLRQGQKTAMSNVLSIGPLQTEQITAWVQRLDAAVDIGRQVDLANAMDEREQRLQQKKQLDWLQGNPYVTGSDRIAWWKAVQQLRTTLLEIAPPPDPVTLATPDALLERSRRLLASIIEKTYPPIDPEDVSLSIRKVLIDPHAPSGTSPYGSGVSTGTSTRFVDDRRSMTQWAMANLTQEERNAAHHAVVGPLTFAQIVELIERANIGARLPADLLLTARARQGDWMLFKAKQIRAQAWAAHISGDLRHDHHNTGLKLILAALDSPTPLGRAKVNGHEVVVRQLQWGDSVLKELLVFGVKSAASRPSLTLYTPGAPDAKIFRDVDAADARALETALVQTLTATTQMTRWLVSHLPLLEQTEQLDSMMPPQENQTFEERVKNVTQSVFAWTKGRAQKDFELKISSPIVTGNLFEVLHETQINHALKTIDVLTVTNIERDNAQAREERRHGVALLTGAMTLAPANRLGGILGRAILPTMVAGAAVSAIDNTNGSFSQWTIEFIGGLGEVLAEAGQDLIMARARRHRSTPRPALSAMPRMPKPELEPFVLRGFDGKGLVAEGRSRYRDASGQGYLRLENDYYKTAVQGGEQIIYAPDNRMNQRTVIWDNGRWNVEKRLGLLGGGPVLSFFRTPELPERIKYNALMESAMASNRGLSPESVSAVKLIINSMPDELADRLLRECMEAQQVSNVEAYRAKIKALHYRQNTPPDIHTFFGQLRDKVNIWDSVNDTSARIEANVTPLTTSQKIKIYDLLYLHKKEFLQDDKCQFRLSVVTDMVTGAMFVTYTPLKGKKREAMDAISNTVRDTYISVARAIEAKVNADFPGNGADALAAKRNYLESEEYQNDRVELIRAERTRLNQPGILTAIKSKKILYVIINKGKTHRKTTLAMDEDIATFSRELDYYNSFEIDAVTQAPSNIVTGPQPVTTAPANLPHPSTSAKEYTVEISPLAEMQMSYRSFREPAERRLQTIMEHLRTMDKSKTINKHCYFDMAQLAPGTGRGRWRAACKRVKDTWTIEGFYDYHNARWRVWEG